MSVRDRIVVGLYFATGLVWTGRALLEVIAHPDYFEPVTPVDWIAVWTYSLAFTLLAASLVVISVESVVNKAVRVIGRTAAAAALVAGIANGMEDAFDLAVATPVYVLGALATAFGMLAMAVSFAVTRRPLWLATIVLMLAGVVGISVGIGALVLIGAIVATRARRSSSAPDPAARHAPPPR